MIGQLSDNSIKLKRLYIASQLPKELEPLRELSQNLWWSWNHEAIELLRGISPTNWEASNYNPVAILDELSLEQAETLTSDKDYMARLKKVQKQFETYLSVKPKTQKIAYFCMEYGLHISMRLYSGGLGVLAGDYLKEASDANVDLVAVGLLYRYGYFQQSLSIHGDQINNYPPEQFTKLPIQPVKGPDGDWIKVNIDLHGRTVWAKVWELKVGRISLYLLDTDIDENSWEDRSLTHLLYGGDNEHRLKQEILLGLGGARALKAIGIEADIYHCNEGHAAFQGLERVKDFVAEGLSFKEAVELVKASSLFTTHTPVPAGHDYFSEGQLRHYFSDWPAKLGITWEDFIALGRIRADDPQELFSMSHLAIRLSQEVNGVSKLHGSVSQKMFNALFPVYQAEELHISYVTNSVHYPTWIANAWHQLYVKTFGPKFLTDQSNKSHWRKIHTVADETILDLRSQLRKRLLDKVRSKLQKDLTRRGESPRAIFEIINNIKDDVLVIGFARRFATYKRAHLLFSNLDRLDEIVNHPERPVMFIFSGKAHPADTGGQDLIRHIIHVSKQARFAGKVVFLENYNMEVAKYLVQGVDIWLNTPTRPKEASGTSGMKAALNGIMNFSVLDGWWAEGYRPDAGWALPLERTYQDQNLQNELDAESIYNILEGQIVPTFYQEGKAKWVGFIKQTIAEVAPQFTMKRMLDDYFERFYNKLAIRSALLKKDHFAEAKQLTAWKKKMQAEWPGIQVLSSDIFDSENNALPVGEPFKAKLKLSLGQIDPKNIGVEVVFFKRIDEAELALKLKEELTLAAVEGQVATYSCAIEPKMAGVYEFGFRIYPKSDLLPHQQDMALVKWV
ncbi:MAG: alpha-glucan family phosphorylase [Saprospiraceae bacterium]